MNKRTMNKLSKVVSYFMILYYNLIVRGVRTCEIFKHTVSPKKYCVTYSSHSSCHSTFDGALSLSDV